MRGQVDEWLTGSCKHLLVDFVLNYEGLDEYIAGWVFDWLVATCTGRARTELELGYLVLYFECIDEYSAGWESCGWVDDWLVAACTGRARPELELGYLLLNPRTDLHS